MNKLVALFLLVSISFSAFAQTRDAYTKAEESDPQAKAILEKLSAKYDTYKTLEVKFSIDIQIPEQDNLLIQKGTLAQSGDKYRVDMKDQSFICDGQSLWFHQPAMNEVQINDAAEMEEDLLSPKDLMKIYEKKDYVYALVNQFVEKGIPIQQIEFKPIDKSSEYAKIRLSVNKKKNSIMHIKVFAKDGSRYTFKISEITPNKKFATNYFQFDAKKFPGVHVEDLRID